MANVLPDVHNLGDLIPDSRDDADPWLTEIAEDGTTTRYSLGDLRAQADGLGRALLARGLAKGGRVGILAGNSARYLIAYFGIMRAGLCAVPINFKLPRDSIAHVLRDAEVRLTLTDAARMALLPDDHPRLRLDLEDDWQALQDPGPLPMHRPALREAANILYTSGSTGMPKGVPLTHDGFVHALRASVRTVPQPWDARVLVAAPLYHMNGLFTSKMALAAGAEEILFRKFDPRAYLRAIARHRGTCLTAIPTMMAMCLRETDLIDTLDLNSVETLIIGSSPVSSELVHDLRRIWPDATITNSYGTTESGPTAFMPHPEGLPTPPGAMGVASDMVELKLMGGTEDEGTLWVRSPVVMPGYLNLPGKTAEKLHEGWYDTGDVMRRDAEGFFYFVDRADDMFVCGGENIHPGDVEQMLQRHPDIAEVCVVPVPDRIKGQLPAAFVVPRPGARIDAQSVKDFALEHGPAYQHPRFVEFMDQLPWQGTNKVDRKTLKARAATFSRDRTTEDEGPNR